jgi:hypothetical protein
MTAASQSGMDCRYLAVTSATVKPVRKDLAIGAGTRPGVETADDKPPASRSPTATDLAGVPASVDAGDADRCTD